MQFGAESGLEEAVGDLGVGKRLALGRAPAADLVMLGRRRNDRRGGKREGGDGGGNLHDTMRAATSGHHHGGGQGGPQCPGLTVARSCPASYDIFARLQGRNQDLLNAPGRST